MKKKIIGIGALVLAAAAILGGYLWIKTDIPEMEFTYSDDNDGDIDIADWRLDKDGTVTVYGSGKITWLEVEYRYRLHTQSEKGSLYAMLKYKFDDCPIKKIVIGKDVTGTIEEYDPFNYCSQLAEITVDEENPYFSSENGVLFNKDKTTLIAYPEGKKDRAYTVPQSVTAIQGCAFRKNAYLSSLTLPEGLQTIGTQAFQFCAALREVTLPDGLKTVEENAFFECNRLKTVFVPASVEEIGEYALGIYVTKSLFKENDFAPVKGFKLTCPENAAAAIAYAKENNIDYEIVAP